jgi:hypothetical protein
MSAPHCESGEREEIEITPEMIEIGCYELAQYNPTEDSPEPVVLAIFEAMIEAHGRLSNTMLGIEVVNIKAS